MANRCGQCGQCGQLLSRRFIDKGWKYCEVCNQQWIDDKKDKFSREINRDYVETVRGLKATVSHSRQGMPRRQQWGTHIINPMR